MTRRDYELIATAVREAREQVLAALHTEEDVAVADDILDVVVGHLALRLADDNDRFDSTRFKEACEA